MMAHAPHAEAIVTPHPLRQAAETPQPLLSVVDPESIADELEGASDSDYEEMAITAADFICSQVRSALWYPERSAEQDDFKTFGVGTPVSLAALPEKQVADCFGFTIVASECIDAAGIDHWIGFANGHSGLLFPSEKSEKLHFIDPLSPVLSQDLQHSMVSGSSVTEDMSGHGRSAIELNSRSLARRAKGNDIDLLREHPWLVFRRGSGPNALTEDYLRDSRPFRSKKPHDPHLKILMSVFRPADGRQVLQDYNAFQLAYNEGDYVGAAARIQSMRGSFPEVDARKPHTEIKRIAFEFGRNDRVAFARRVLDSYFESFVLMDGDSRFKVAYGDALRVLGREGRDIEATQMAIDKYEEALDRKKFPKAYRETVRAKLAKAVRLYVQLETAAYTATDP